MLALVMGDERTSIQDLRAQARVSRRQSICSKRARAVFTSFFWHARSITHLIHGQNLMDDIQKIRKPGVRHQDIWPTNILRGEDSSMFVIEFYMAGLLDYPSEKMEREMTKLTNISGGIDEDDGELLYSIVTTN